MEQPRDYYSNGTDTFYRTPNFIDEEITYYEIPKAIKINDDLVIPAGKIEYSKNKCNLTKKDTLLYTDEQRRLRNPKFLFTYSELNIEI